MVGRGGYTGRDPSIRLQVLPWSRVEMAAGDHASLVNSIRYQHPTPDLSIGRYSIEISEVYLHTV